MQADSWALSGTNLKSILLPETALEGNAALLFAHCVWCTRQRCSLYSKTDEEVVAAKTGRFVSVFRKWFSPIGTVLWSQPKDNPWKADKSDDLSRRERPLTSNVLNATCSSRIREHFRHGIKCIVCELTSHTVHLFINVDMRFSPEKLELTLVTCMRSVSKTSTRELPKIHDWVSLWLEI